jgi:hypothetical protein
MDPSFSRDSLLRWQSGVVRFPGSASRTVGFHLRLALLSFYHFQTQAARGRRFTRCHCPLLLTFVYLPSEGLNCVICIFSACCEFAAKQPATRLDPIRKNHRTLDAYRLGPATPAENARPGLLPTTISPWGVYTPG